MQSVTYRLDEIRITLYRMPPTPEFPEGEEREQRTMIFRAHTRTEVAPSGLWASSPPDMVELCTLDSTIWDDYELGLFYTLSQVMSPTTPPAE